MTRDAYAPLAATAALLAFLGVVRLRTMYRNGTPMWMLIVIVVAVLVVLIVLAVLARKFWPRSSAHAKLRSTENLSDMIGRDAAEKGVKLRASIGGVPNANVRKLAKSVDMRQLASVIGRIGRTILYKSFEEFTLVFMGPRSNKTSAVAVPRILSAPGAVVSTSNKPDLWILTSALRAALGPVYAFDPGNIAFVPQTWWWNILGHVRKLKDAVSLADTFMDDTSGGDKSKEDAFFTPTARNLLAWTILAAAIEPGCTMRDVLIWISTFSDRPRDILRAHGLKRMTLSYTTVLELPNTTKGGVYGGANTALACIQDEDTLRWVTPPQSWEQFVDGAAEIEELDLWSLFAFEEGNVPTLYLMSQEGSGSAGPLLTAMVTRIFEIGNLTSSALGGRVDPPITIVLDECANICRIKQLPELASWLGSKSISVDAIFQSKAQMQAVWGHDRAQALWLAATVKICGAGLQDKGFAEELSGLIGTHKITEHSYSSGRGGGSTSEHKVREPIMPPEDVAAIKKENALLIRPGAKPVLMDLIPWYNEPDAGDIAALSKIATTEMRNAAIAELGNDNPVARALHAASTKAAAPEQV